MPSLPACQPHHTAWCHSQTCWEYFQSYFSVSPVKMSKCPVPNTNPWGAPLNTTCFHLDVKLLATTLWVRLSSQFFIDQVVHLSHPHGSRLETRMLCGIASSALHKPRYVTYCSSLILSRCNPHYRRPPSFSGTVCPYKVMFTCHSIFHLP